MQKREGLGTKSKEDTAQPEGSEKTTRRHNSRGVGVFGRETAPGRRNSQGQGAGGKKQQAGHRTSGGDRRQEEKEAEVTLLHSEVTLLGPYYSGGCFGLSLHSPKQRRKITHARALTWPSPL